ncbi:hypothetical protein BKA70DRAFT_1460514 [Coprinopsis sp. MPI-PUGE-AT-0042]|nr:hypothetical protein BKA70DRAFT_1481977 [Coprinopsis sp. MPI-PUGE-AT-0042]KAH6911258.1 hypothetical protein BKA70DRAFT_1460514 [Coprinopsis sp. MPI-PUGE-AT-0042]
MSLIEGRRKASSAAELHGEPPSSRISLTLKVPTKPTKYSTTITNDVILVALFTPHQWLDEHNPPLSNLITQTLKVDKKDHKLIEGLLPFTKSINFRKQKLAGCVQSFLRTIVRTDAMFDVQNKLTLKDMAAVEKKDSLRTIFFAGKTVLALCIPRPLTHRLHRQAGMNSLRVTSDLLSRAPHHLPDAFPLHLADIGLRKKNR